RNDIRTRAASDHADIDGDAAPWLVHRFQLLNHVGEFADGAAAILGARSRMRRRALDVYLEPTDSFAPGDDLPAVTSGFGHQDEFGLFAFGLDQRPRCRAADLLVRNIDLGHAKG